RYDGSWKRIQHAINSEFMVEEKDLPLARCFASAFEFLDINRTADPWFLMLECFDPHEPFQAPARFKERYQTGWSGGILDWPIYEKSTGSSPEEIAEIRANYAALVAACDDYFGQLLDYFDRHDLWRDTALILSTDHGFLLAEHDWWGKNLQPYYTEISHVPLLVHHPAFASQAGARRRSLTQTMDLMPTFLDLFEIAAPSEVRAASVVPLLDADNTQRDIGIFGMFGGPIGATDGRYTYYLYPHDLYAPGLHEYTLMPMHLSSLFSESEMKTAVMAKPFDFTKGMPVMRIDALKDARRIPIHDDKKFDPDFGTTLYDLANDPKQMKPFRDAALERRFQAGIVRQLRAHDAPMELYGRYGLDIQTAKAAPTEEETT
ncbi:MAG TPA: sulfatase-like hydrolase/transferase, partial [Casimicrobiaceae bacterium]|nr:sulfatase-like hydrolase/transferase [Casimicrobiaceae bacterium]